MNLTLDSITTDITPTVYNTIYFFKNSVYHILKINSTDVINSVTDLQLFYVDINDNFHLIELDYFSYTNNQLVIYFYNDLAEGAYKNKLLINTKINNKFYKQYISGFNIKTIITSNFNFNVKRKTYVPIESNFLITRAKANVPTWSTPFTKEVSNYSKLLEPSYKYINSCYSKLKDIIKNKRNLVSYQVNEKPFKVVASSGKKHLNYHNLKSSNHKQLAASYLLDIGAPHITFKSFVYHPNFNFKDIAFSGTHLYVKKETENTNTVIFIEGFSGNKIVSESLNLQGTNVKATLHKYDILIKVNSKESLEISDHVDCTKNFTYYDYNITPTPLFINERQNFEAYLPQYRLESNNQGDTPVLVIYDKLEVKYKYSFTTPVVDSLYIDDSLNIYWTSADTLYQSNLGLSQDKHTTNVYENSNKYLYTDTSEYLLNDWIEVSANFPSLLQDVPDTSSAVLSVTIDDVVKYFNTELNTLVDHKYVIQGDSLNSIYTFSMLCDKPEGYVVTLQTNKNNYTLNTIPKVIPSTNFINLPTDSLLLNVYNNKLVLVGEQYGANFLDNTYTGATTLVFYWNGVQSLDFDLDFYGYLINTVDKQLDDSFIKRLTSDGSRLTESYLLDMNELLKISPNSSLVFKVKSKYSKEESLNKTAVIDGDITATCLITLSDGTTKSITLHPLITDTEEYEYTITVTGNTITEALNVNY